MVELHGGAYVWIVAGVTDPSSRVYWLAVATTVATGRGLMLGESVSIAAVIECSGTRVLHCSHQDMRSNHYVG